MSAPSPAPGQKPGLVKPGKYADFIELYNQIAKKVLLYKDQREKLADILITSMPNAQRNREFQVAGNGRMTKLQLAKIYKENPGWMNPFSFFAFFNLYLPPNRVGNWKTWLANLGGAFALDAGLVERAKNQMPWPHEEDQHYREHTPAHYFETLDGWMQNYHEITDKDVVDRLWRLADYATNKLPPNPETKDDIEKQFIKDFNAIAPILRVEPMLTAGLNWMNPGVWIRIARVRYADYYPIF
jgi:hypothetical protein